MHSIRGFIEARRERKIAKVWAKQDRKEAPIRAIQSEPLRMDGTRYAMGAKTRGDQATAAAAAADEHKKRRQRENNWTSTPVEYPLRTTRGSYHSSDQAPSYGQGRQSRPGMR